MFKAVEFLNHSQRQKSPATAPTHPMFNQYKLSRGINNSEGIIVLVSNTFISAIVETTETEYSNIYTPKLQTPSKSYHIKAV